MVQHWIVVQEIAGFKPAQIFFYFCPRRETHVLSNVTLGCVLYCTIATRVPFRPTTVQVSN